MSLLKLQIVIAELSALDPHDPPTSVQNHMKLLNYNF